MLHLARSDLERLFSEPVWRKAEELVANGAVLDVSVERDGKSVSGRVRGDRRTPYLTRVRIANGRGGRVRIASTCTCIVYSECEHAAATLLGAIEKNATADPEDANVAIDPELEAWINQVNAAIRAAPQQAQADGADCVLYLLEPTQRSWRDSAVAQPVAVSAVRARRLRPGVYGREHPLAVGTLLAEDPPPFVTMKDHLIGRLLGSFNGSGKRLSGVADAEALLTMLETGRCHWRNSQNKALTLGEPRAGRFAWRFDGEGQQHVVCALEEAAQDVVIVALGQPWYVDLANMVCGRVDTGVPDRVAHFMLQAPAIAPSAASVARQRLVPSGSIVPLPEPLRRRERLEVKPIPVLHLHCPRVTASRGLGWKREEEEVDLPLARLTFDYAGAEVGWQDSRTELNHVKDNRLLVLPRDALQEVQAYERLQRVGLQPLGPTGLGRFAPDICRQDLTFEEDEDNDVSMRWVEFNHRVLPQLVEEGWRITFADDYPYQVVRPDGAWSADVTDTGVDWFELDLGIEVEGRRVPLLPLLLDLFKRAPDEMTPAALEAFGDEPVYGTLPDGRLLPIPASRLRGILEALYDLFAANRVDPERPLRLGRAEALRLASLERALPNGALVWSGGAELRSMARRLADNVGTLPDIAPPRNLKATLRGYQRDGLRWLQFLAQTGLSGVLADDMGLGKTLQTLAHILVEKETGRLTRPCLVVAPTSLIPTWRNEVRKFAPHLRLLVLHGNDRHDYFAGVDVQEVVLTSYALLLRDADQLLAREWHMVVLDEAQAIKNPSTKLARTAAQLRAPHRVALTGTPMENHLGELWSVFNFLLPGFLGEREEFRRVFRNQIEKEGDEERRALLAARVRPFMLRRRKEQVAAELPPKTEMIREVELADQQRDLYELVRVAMHARLREEIAARGLARSNIAILEALLKLRQVCCHPRLLKNGETSTAPSAKFELLMDMLPAMVENDRRIIIFSQFVEMLELIEEALGKAGLDYVKLTGQTRDRETPVRRFQAGEVPIFLISLKAGGVGITLTRADTVIHYDPWWNPAVEAQATDRAHRIGQDKTVFVYKLIAAGTVEEKMVQLQARKRALIEGVLSGTGSGLTFTEEDIANLFAPLPAV
jgi:superfamily II DNA or RNA helicase